MTPVGYVVLTSQSDGSWKDDWDGEVHPAREQADAELARAQSALGADAARLVTLYPVDEADRLREMALDGAWLAWLCRHPDREDAAEFGWPEMTTVLNRLDASPEMEEVVLGSLAWADEALGGQT